MTTDRHSLPVPGREALTLFEVAISLAIVAAVVVSAVLAFPVGLKAAQMARFQVLAGTKALEIATDWAQTDHAYWECNTEVEDPALAQFTAIQNDLDTMNDHGSFGLFPLPTAMARRFDSDGDEIARLLDNGGRLYYSPSIAIEAGYSEREGNPVVDPLPVEAQSLVFGVIGYAQQNVLPSHPCIAMPYYDCWPSPPQDWERVTWQQNSGTWPGSAEFNTLWGNY